MPRSYPRRLLEDLTLPGSATLIKASYRFSSLCQFFPHSTSLAPPVWNTRAHSVGEEGYRAGHTVWMEPPTVNPLSWEPMNSKNFRSLSTTRSFRGHFIQLPPWAGIFVISSLHLVASVKGSSWWSETTPPLLESSDYWKFFLTLNRKMNLPTWPPRTAALETSQSEDKGDTPPCIFKSNITSFLHIFSGDNTRVLCI